MRTKVMSRGMLVSVVMAVSATRVSAQTARVAPTYDLVIEGGRILDGTGRPMFAGDVAIMGHHIACVGVCPHASARATINARGLYVAPGFINIHSHAQPPVLPTAVNMLTQGVTTELLNADGDGPLDIGAQLDTLAAHGLAVNVGASAGFNSVWETVMGPSDKRPTRADITRMQKMIVDNLQRGAFGVSAGLDYKPAYFSTVPEAIQVLEPTRPWRTFFPNHDRLTPEGGFSSRKGMEETMAIGAGTGLVPVFTHMKVQGHEQGTADAVLEMMRAATAKGMWVAADVYPYLAGHTALAALIIPGWAQDGGVEKMRARFADAALRARIIAESNAAIAARFNGPQSILLNETGRKLSDIMAQQGIKTPGEAVVKILETEYPSAILSFGAEADLIKILQYPSAAVACDCGAWTETKAHPRGFGTFPRILGHYVRDTHVLTWENAVRKMSALPASIMGLVDRGMLAPGMAADVVVFDPATVIDHATYEKPDALSEGIRAVLVNGTVALRDGKATGARGGAALRRSGQMPSRPLQTNVTRSVKVSGDVRVGNAMVASHVNIAVTQSGSAQHATGVLALTLANGQQMSAQTLGVLQPGARWATITGMANVAGASRAFTLIVDAANPLAAGTPKTMVLQIDGLPNMTGTITGTMEISAR